MTSRADLKILIEYTIERQKIVSGLVGNGPWYDAEFSQLALTLDTLMNDLRTTMDTADPRDILVRFT